ncbi:MAG: PHP domain-containing protein, partial [Pseudomonadales bacterium]|nr:PHP domain-containing protein [Pseudomonadales bacterium]
MTQFVHLHLHSEFSLADGILKVKDLVRQTAALDMPAVALTDINNLFALVKFYETCTGQGVKPLLGCELMIESDGSGPPERIVLLAMNAAGYANLRVLVSKAYTDTDERGVLSEAAVFARGDGLIVLSGGIRGHLWTMCEQKNTQTLKDRIQKWRRVFGTRYYI